jgi:hypothetical protein
MYLHVYAWSRPVLGGSSGLQEGLGAGMPPFVELWGRGRRWGVPTA